MKTLVEIMAQSVGAIPQQNKNCDVEYLMSVESLERFAELVRADERAACLQIADQCADADMDASMAANAIRARTSS